MSEKKERETSLLKPEPFSSLQETEVAVQDGKTKHIVARTTQIIACALVFVFLSLFLLAFAYLFWQPKSTPEAASAAIAQTIDLMKTISAVLSGLVGSVVVYYFHVEKKDSGQ